MSGYITAKKDAPRGPKKKHLKKKWLLVFMKVGSLKNRNNFKKNYITFPLNRPTKPNHRQLYFWKYFTRPAWFEIYGLYGLPGLCAWIFSQRSSHVFIPRINSVSRCEGLLAKYRDLKRKKGMEVRKREGRKEEGRQINREGSKGRRERGTQAF